MSTATRRAFGGGAIVVLLALITALGMVPGLSQAADHLDAPGLASPGGDARFDINDLFVFEGSNASRTVLAATVNPIATGDSTFLSARSGAYFFRVDNNGDAREDVTYSAQFIDIGSKQLVLVRKATGKQARDDRPRGGIIGVGRAGDTIQLRGGGKLFTGLRSDPFFFDLGGFLGSVEGANNGRTLNDGSQSDFFSSLNTLAIVLEVNDGDLGSNIGVWSTTSKRNGGDWNQIDRMGRPAINTVVNSSGPLVQADSNAKNVFNRSKPKSDVANFTTAVIDALQVYSSLGTQYTDAEAAALAAVLLPDLITYDTSTSAAGPLNGRALADDVIDIELGIVTNGAITTDGVGPHTDYQAGFPYLGNPHS